MYETDQEQIEAMKSWWSQNANWVIGGFVAFILAFVGYHWYQSSAENHRLEASAKYEELLALSDTDSEARTALISDLKEQYDDLAYATLAVLNEAKAAVEAGDLSSALASLDWAEAKADAKLLPIILYRKAQILYAQSELDGALSALNQIKGDGHQAMTLELKGDVLLAQGKVDEARTAYQQALEMSAQQSINNPYLKMKADDLAQAAE